MPTPMPAANWLGNAPGCRWPCGSPPNSPSPAQRHPLIGLVDELADLQRRLDLLDAGGDRGAGRPVKAVFSWSYHHLPTRHPPHFRLLGLHPGPELDPYAAAALTNSSLDHARGSSTCSPAPISSSPHYWPVRHGTTCSAPTPTAWPPLRNQRTTTGRR